MLQLKNGTKQRRPSLAARSFESWQLLQNDNYYMTRISLKLYKPANPTVSREKAIENNQADKKDDTKRIFMKLPYTKEMNGHIPEETFFFF